MEVAAGVWADALPVSIPSPMRPTAAVEPISILIFIVFVSLFFELLLVCCLFAFAVPRNSRYTISIESQD